MIESVAKLSKLARQYAIGILGDFSHQSLPIPFGNGNSPECGFFYCRAEIVQPRLGLQLWAPSYLLRVKFTNGLFVSLSDIYSANKNPKPTQDPFIGSYLTLAEQKTTPFLSDQMKLMQLYDILLPSYFFGDSIPDLDARRVEFNTLFDHLCEKPLRQYYSRLAPKFFSNTEVSVR